MTDATVTISLQEYEMLQAAAKVGNTQMNADTSAIQEILQRVKRVESNVDLILDIK